jgi:hypothetical protein
LEYYECRYFPDDNKKIEMYSYKIEVGGFTTSDEGRGRVNEAACTYEAPQDTKLPGKVLLQTELAAARIDIVV